MEKKKKRELNAGEGRRGKTRKGGHGRCCRRKKRRWYKREEVGKKSKTMRKSGTKGDTAHSTGGTGGGRGRGGLKKGSEDRDGGTEREGGASGI